eukprot:scaffold323_cov232-Pinguiococcus_pyrenoidosus.AAC.16
MDLDRMDPELLDVHPALAGGLQHLLDVDGLRPGVRGVPVGGRAADSTHLAADLRRRGGAEPPLRLQGRHRLLAAQNLRCGRENLHQVERGAQVELQLHGKQAEGKIRHHHRLRHVFRAGQEIPEEPNCHGG